MKRFLGVLLLVAAARAELDGAIAEPARWTGPNGPPGRTRRSRAMPITRDVVEAWSLPLPDEAVAPPVTWDGILYVLCKARLGHQLLAVDIASGRKLAQKAFKKAPYQGLHVWSGVVVMRTSDKLLTGVKRVGKTFLEKWRYSRGTAKTTPFRPDSLTVVENEIYVLSGGTLLRVAPGLKTPVWSQAGSYCGPPTICGNTVLVFDGRAGCVVSVERGSGLVSGRSEKIVTGNGYCGITVGLGRTLVKTPASIRTSQGSASYCFFDHSIVGNSLRLGKLTGCFSFRVVPAVYRDGFLACEGRNEWQLWTDRGKILAQRRYTPDLFRNLVPPTVVGNVVYFGTWAADIDTGEIFWRLPVEQVKFGAIPADRLCIVVEAGDHEVLRAYRSRVGR